MKVRKSARNHEKSGKKSGEIARETPLFCLSMRSRPFAHAHLRNPRENIGFKTAEGRACAALGGWY